MVYYGLLIIVGVLFSCFVLVTISPDTENIKTNNIQTTTVECVYNGKVYTHKGPSSDIHIGKWGTSGPGFDYSSGVPCRKVFK